MNPIKYYSMYTAPDVLTHCIAMLQTALAVHKDKSTTKENMKNEYIFHTFLFTKIHCLH